MMEDQNANPQLSELLIELLEGTISQDRLEQLEKHLAQDPAALDYYAEFLTIHMGLSKPRKVPEVIIPPEEETLPTAAELLAEVIERDEKRRVQREAEEARRAAEIKKEEVRQYAEEAFKKFKEDEQRRLEKLAYKQYRARQRNLILGIGSLAATLIFVVLAWLFSPTPADPPNSAPVAPPIVATITESKDAQWANSSFPMETDTQLVALTDMHLKRGLVQITFDSGAEIILQAPCKFQLEEENQMFLQSGHLAAVVPRQAKGFTVRSTGATVVDYGTEFGVIAHPGGEMEAHVFKGEVDLRLGSDRLVFERSKRLKKGWAGRVSGKDSLTVEKIESRPNLFVRQIPKKEGFGIAGWRLDLADIIGGGNGLGTGELNRSINPDNGEIRSGFYRQGQVAVPAQSCDYIPVNMDFVDGVFVPDSSLGLVAVNSRGDIFYECPDTNGRYCWDVFNGNAVDKKDKKCRQIIDGKKYGTSDAPAISMHSNSGITFDIAKIRSTLTGNHITSFTARCGVADGPFPNTKMDFWVLVDGQNRFHLKDAMRRDFAQTIRLELTDEDKFLTLMVTQGSDIANDPFCSGDWGIFAEPALILNPIEGQRY
jgi:anti-sigma factor RsiW